MQILILVYKMKKINDIKILSLRTLPYFGGYLPVLTVFSSSCCVECYYLILDLSVFSSASTAIQTFRFLHDSFFILTQFSLCSKCLSEVNLYQCRFLFLFLRLFFINLLRISI